MGRSSSQKKKKWQILDQETKTATFGTWTVTGLLTTCDRRVAVATGEVKVKVTL